MFIPSYYLSLANGIRTYPTTYVAYEGFNHIFAVPSSSECVDTTEEVRLPSPTNYSPLIFPQASITVQGLPPVALISYLDTLPTVTEQLSGTVASSCDPIVGSTVTPKTVNQNDNQPTTVAQLDGNSATTSTHYTIAAIDTAGPPLPSNTAVPPASSSAAPRSSIAPSIAPASSAAASNLQSSSPIRPPALQTGLTAPIAPASSAALNSNTLIAPAQSSLNTVGSGTNLPPPTPASSSALPLQATGAAAHQRANMQYVGLEHWLIGAAGIGLGWL